MVKYKVIVEYGGEETFIIDADNEKEAEAEAIRQADFLNATIDDVTIEELWK